MTREDIIEAYMINDKHVIAEMLYDTITKYEEKLKSKSCEGCKYDDGAVCRNPIFGACIRAYQLDDYYEPKDKE